MVKKTKNSNFAIEATKKATKAVTGPLVYIGKNLVGKEIYKKTMNQPGVKGRIGRSLANYLKDKGWFR